MTTIKAIETEYAGHRFRSRLEARWAVFFDHMQIAWEYEAEGYEMSDGTRYLPDFRLSSLWLRPFVEVKGSQDSLLQDLPRIQSLVNGSNRPCLILGPVPDLLDGLLPAAAPMHSLLWPGADLARSTLFGFSLAGAFLLPTASELEPKVHATHVGGLVHEPRIQRAYRAARQARFEFGERG